MVTALAFTAIGTYINTLTEQKKIVVIIISHNNEQSITRTLESVIVQKYERKKIVYLDDGSTDNTCSTAIAYMHEQQAQSTDFTHIHSSKHEGRLAHLYRIIQKCQDNDIIIPINGSDWLADANLFSIINDEYSDHELWLLRGLGTAYPYRNYSATPLCTFYAALFKRLKLEDLLDKDSFQQTDLIDAPIALLKILAGTHYKEINKLFIVRSCPTKYTKQTYNGSHYAALEALAPSTPCYTTAPDIIIFSQTPSHLKTLCTAISKYFTHYGSLFVLYLQEQSTSGHYAQFATELPGIHCIHYDSSNFYAKYRELLQNIKSSTVILSVDSLNLISHVDLRVCSHALINTGLDIFYLPLGATICTYGMTLSEDVACIDTDNKIYTWSSLNKSGAWLIPTLEMTIFSTEYLKTMLETTAVKSYENLKFFLHRSIVKENKVGLMFDQSKIITRN